MMGKLFLASSLVLTLAVLFFGCARPAPATKPTPTPSPTPKITPSPTPTPTPSPTPAPETAPERLFLRVTEPPNESVVHDSSVSLRGITTPDAVVSVDGEFVEVDEEGNFTTTVTLKEGPNVIEVIASDYEGNEESQILTLIYIPK